MKYLMIFPLFLLFSFPALAASDPQTTFDTFMKMAQTGDLKKAIKEQGIDERSDKSFLNIKVPGKLTYEIKDTDQKKSGDEATVSAVIEYQSVTEEAKGATGKLTTAGKAVSGNIVGAAGSMGKNKVDGSLSSVRDKEKVKMKKAGGEWKVVVTDKLFDVLTGKGK